MLLECLFWLFRNCAKPYKLTFYPKKNASMSALALYFCITKNYFFVLSACFPGVTGAGLTDLGAAISFSLIIFELASLKLPEKLKLDNKIKTIRIVANVQVLLSKKSVVF